MENKRLSISSYSKKDVAIRRKELLEAVSPPLLKYLCENARSMVMDKACSVAVSDILGAAIGDLRPAMEAVAALAAEPLIPGGEDGQVTHLQVSPNAEEICCTVSNSSINVLLNNIFISKNSAFIAHK